MVYADTLRVASANFNTAAALIEGIFSSTYGLTFSSWTPTISVGSGTIGATTVDYAKYIQVGKLVIAIVKIHGTTTGTPTSIRVTLPVTASSSSNVFGCGLLIDSGSELAAVVRNSSTTVLQFTKYDGTGFTAGAGRYVAGIAIYEAA